MSNGACYCEATMLINPISCCLSFAFAFLSYVERGGGYLNKCDSDNPHISKGGYFGGFVAPGAHGEEIMPYCGFLQIISVQVRWKLRDE